jgi:nicotinate-nucleotide adenylyltransferase
VGVFGSLFNPPHIGHLLLCSEAAWQLGLERVVLVPTALPPHRPTPAEPAELRARLAAAAATCDPVLTMSRIELDRPGPSYTVDTLRELAERHPAKELVLLLGADQLAALGAWHQAELVPRLATIAVAQRPGLTVGGLAAAAVEHIDMPAIGVSSSEIRARVAAHRPIRHLVPEPVRLIIESEGLYLRPAAQPGQGAPGSGVIAWTEETDRTEHGN